MKAILAVLLVFVLLASGCVIPGTDIEIPFLSGLFGPTVEEFRNDVVAIQSLDAIPYTTMRSGQSLTLKAVVKNLQSPENEPQKDVIITLFNTCGIFDVVESESSCLVSGESPAIKHDTTSDTYYCTITKMYPQSTALVQWRLKARDVKVKTPCNIGVMAQYNYTTYTTSSVSFINQQELENLRNQGTDVSESGSMVVGEGPIKSYIEIPDQPVLIGQTGENTALMIFWVENKGSGRLVNNRIEAKGISISSEESQISGIQGCLDKLKDGVVLIGKESPKYSCEIKPVDTHLIKQEKTYQIASSVNYTYAFTKELKVTIEPNLNVG